MHLGNALGIRLKRWYGGGVSVSAHPDLQHVADLAQATAARQPALDFTTLPSNLAMVSYSANGSFTTNADFMTVAGAGPNTTFSNIMIACLFRVRSGYQFTGTHGVIAQVGAGGTAGAILFYNTSTQELLFASEAGASLAFSNAGFVIGDNTVHTAVGYATASGAARLVIDGVLQTGTSGTASATGFNLSTAEIRVGATDASGTLPFQGLVANIGIAVDNVAFSATDYANVHAALLEYKNGTPFSIPSRQRIGPRNDFAPRVKSWPSDGVRMIFGQADAVATATGSISGLVDANGNALATATASGALDGLGSLAGTATAIGSAIGAVTGNGVCAGTSTATCTASGALLGTGDLAGTATAVCTATGAASALGVLAGTADAVCSATGSLSGPGAIAGTVTATCTTTGSMTGSGALTGSALAVCSTSGILTGLGNLAGTAMATCLSTGVIFGFGALAGTVTAVASASCSVTGDGACVGTATAVGSATGLIEGAGVLVGSSIATCTAVASLIGFAALDGNALATATASGALDGLGTCEGIALATCSSTGDLSAYVSGALDGSAFATCFATALLDDPYTVYYRITCVAKDPVHWASTTPTTPTATTTMRDVTHWASTVPSEPKADATLRDPLHWSSTKQTS